MTTEPRLHGYWRWIVALAVAAYVAIWGYRFVVARLGALAPLALLLGTLVVAGMLVAWLWRRFGDQASRAGVQLVRSLWERAAATPWMQRARRRAPGAWRIVTARANPHLATGLGLSLLIVAAAGALWAFTAVLLRVVTGSSMTAVDHRIINLFQTLRTPGADRVMLDVTYVGSGRGVGTLAAAAVIVALLLRRYRDAVLLVAALAAGAAFFAVVKLIIRRPRPPLYDARIVQSGFSFPSGHATIAAVFYATVAVILVTAVRSAWLRVLIVLASVVMIVWIGLSRIYLGVHYPSDVLAGWAAGVLWALLVLVAERIWAAERARRGGRATDDAARPVQPRDAADGPRVADARRVVAAIVPLAAVAFLIVSQPAIPAAPRAQPPRPGEVPDAQLLSAIRTRAPLYTMGLFGHRQEPINLVFLGTGDQVIRAFRAAGWVQAERLSLSSLRRAAIATMTGRADPTGPVTPSFLGEAPESLAFSQPVGRTFARRHHVRIWIAPFRTGGAATQAPTPVWLSTASFDAGYAIASGSLLPVHQIAPDIDDERDYIARSLGATGLVADTTRVQIVPPEMGTNAFGEPFFTYGQAVIARLR